MGSQSEPVGIPPVVVLTSGVMACRGVVPLLDRSVTHRCVSPGENTVLFEVEQYCTYIGTGCAGGDTDDGTNSSCDEPLDVTLLSIKTIII
jgi:hypothetical protein